jgi:hypothetical protein
VVLVEGLEQRAHARRFDDDRGQRIVAERDHQAHGADAQHVAGAHHHRAHASSVHRRAGALIVRADLSARGAEHQVPSGDAFVLEHEIAARVAADLEDVAIEPAHLGGAAGAFDTDGDGDGAHVARVPKTAQVACDVAVPPGEMIPVSSNGRA